MGIALIAVVFIFFLAQQTREDKHDWRELYTQTSDEPYGTSVLSNVLKDHFGKGHYSIINKAPRQLLASQDSNGIRNYIFIGYEMYVGQEDIDTLLSFVNKGNQAFIASEVIPDELSTALNLCNSGIEAQLSDSVLLFNLCHPSLASMKGWPFHYEYRAEHKPYQWSYFHFDPSCDSLANYEKLGYFTTDKMNFIRIPYGKGWFYLHLNPIVFTNLFLIQESGVAYAERIFTHLPKGKTVWNEPVKLPHSQDGPSRSPLSYLLSRTAFRWAWYTMLLTIAAYFLFRAIRKQRIIPVILPNENTSLEFIQTVGALYYQQHDHQKLCIQKMKLFLLFIRDKYYLPTNIPDAKLIVKIAAKSKVSELDISKIFSHYQSLKNTVIQVDANDLIAFHKQLDYFYKNCI